MEAWPERQPKEAVAQCFIQRGFHHGCDCKDSQDKSFLGARAPNPAREASNGNAFEGIQCNNFLKLSCCLVQ